MKKVCLLLSAAVLAVRLAAAAPETGVNIISVGNTYSDPQFRDEQLDSLFTALKARGITRISLRVTWATMESEDGSLNPEILPVSTG